MRSFFVSAAFLAFAGGAFAATPLPYVVVTDQSLAASFAPLAAAHVAAGLPAEVHTLQEIQALYPVAADDAERVRLYLKDLYAQRGLRYALLGGDDPLVPIRRVLCRAALGDVQLPTDQYYACLQGTWNADGDANWGELPNPGLGEIGDGQVEAPELAVGRAPVTTPLEAQTFVDKTIAAMAAFDPARPLAALLAANEFPIGPDSLDEAPAAEALLPILAARPSTHVARLYLKSWAWPGSFLESRQSVLDSLRAGYDLAFLAGNGGPGVFQAGNYPQDLVTAPEFLALANPHPGFAFFMSANTTEPGPGSIGRAYVLAPLGGATGVVGPVTSEFISIGNEYGRQLFDQALTHHAPGQGDAVAATVTALSYLATSDNARLTTLGNVLFGDPALAIPGSVEAPVPVRLSLADADVAPGEARLSWYAADARGAATVERRASDDEWRSLGDARSTGDGLYTYVDRVDAGRYAYRLRVGAVVSEETWLNVPGASLALAGFRPNPGRAIAFTLASGAPATLEVFDVRGRVLERREVGALGAGAHVLETSVPAGVYWLRLAQAGAARTARGVVLR